MRHATLEYEIEWDYISLVIYIRSLQYNR